MSMVSGFSDVGCRGKRAKEQIAHSALTCVSMKTERGIQKTIFSEVFILSSFNKFVQVAIWVFVISDGSFLVTRLHCSSLHEFPKQCNAYTSP